MIKWRDEYSSTAIRVAFVVFATMNVVWVVNERVRGDFVRARWDAFWAVFWFYEFYREGQRPTKKLELRHKVLIAAVGCVLFMHVLVKVVEPLVP